MKENNKGRKPNFGMEPDVKQNKRFMEDEE